MSKAVDNSKKEEFRKFLEKSGVLDALTKVLVALYEEPERPANAVDYVKRRMGATVGGSSEIDQVRKENEDLKSKVFELEAIVEKMNLENTNEEE